MRGELFLRCLILFLAANLAINSIILYYMLMRGLKKSYSIRDSEIEAIQTTPEDSYDLPSNVDVIVYFGPHQTKSEFQPLAPLIEASDVFVPEHSMWQLRDVEILSQISQGDRKTLKELKPYEDKMPPFHVSLLGFLLKKNVRVTLVDIPKSDSLASFVGSFYQHKHGGGLKETVTPDFDGTLDDIVHSSELAASVDNYREDIMLRSLGPRLRALIENDSELSNMERVKVLLQLGTYHTFIYHDLKKVIQFEKTSTVNRVFGQEKPIVFNPENHLTRALRKGASYSETRLRLLAAQALGFYGLVDDEILPPLRKSDFSYGDPKTITLEAIAHRLTIQDVVAYHHKLIESATDTHGT
jgi:hypothetical protein